MNERIERCKVSVSGTLLDAMRALDRGAAEIALVMDAGDHMVGTLTDGDVRRALLKGASPSSPLEPHIQRRFTWVGAETGRAAVIELMQARTIGQIPVLNDDGTVIGLHLIHELLGAVERPNWAIIMAGGIGSRLGEVTRHIPKPMLRIAGRPILERLVLHLVGFGIRRIYLAINHLGHVVEEHFGTGEQFGCDIRYLRETKALGTGGPLSILPDVPTMPLVVLNGDLVTQADIGAMLQFHERGGYECTLAIKQYSHRVPYGCVQVTDDRVLHLEEKPLITQLVNAGIYVLDPAVIARVPPNEEFPMTTLLEQSLSMGRPVGAFEIVDDWIDVGLREQLQVAREGPSAKRE